MKKNIALMKAAHETFQRKYKASQPDGCFKNNGTWLPSDTEKCSCCDSIRTPSVKYPYSLMTHCRTAEHIANLYNVDKKDLKKAIKDCKKEIHNAEFKGIFYIKGPEIKSIVYLARIGNKYIIISHLQERTDNPIIREIPTSLEDDSYYAKIMMEWESDIEWWKGPWKHGLFHMKPMDPTKNSTYKSEIWAHYRFVNKIDLLEIFLDITN